MRDSDQAVRGQAQHLVAQYFETPLAEVEAMPARVYLALLAELVDHAEGGERGDEEESWRWEA